jgi:4,5-DOPA dioxygenase extradiol
MNMSRMPTLFLSHGSPMHALDPGGAGIAWQAIAASLPKPRAVLMASAHWETSLPMLSGREQLETIHDFGGFPAELYKVRYDAPGSPEVAQHSMELLRAAGLTPSLNSCRGIDHGAWVPLKWMYPDRDVPVVQVSVQPSLGTAHHLQLGEALAPLAEEGVLIVGSGHVTHNLRDWFAHHADPQPLPYVVQFSRWLQQHLESNDREALLNYRDRGPGAARAHPTEEHFLPLFVALGAAGPDARATLVHQAIDGAALSMDAYRFD